MPRFFFDAPNDQKLSANCLMGNLLEAAEN